MTSARPGVPGHDDGTAFVRLRPEKLADDPPGQRTLDSTAPGRYEIVCPGCGDDPSRDWAQISDELRRIRGIYATRESAEAALMDHVGMQTRLQRPAAGLRRTAQSNRELTLSHREGQRERHADPPVGAADAP